MSSFGILSIKLELTVAGYIREHGEEYRMAIPYDLNSMILMFYQRSYKLFAIGCDTNNQFELKQQYEASHHDIEYDPCAVKEKWYHLVKFSKLCEHPDLIAVARDNYFIRNTKNEIYAIGDNTHGSLGINEVEQSITTFTKLEIPKIDAQLNKLYTIDIMSHGMNSAHSFIVVRNIETNKQLFYAFGNNTHQQQGYESKNARNKTTLFPLKVPALNQLFDNIEIVQITTGSNHSLFLDSNGNVYSCGSNDYGQCGFEMGTHLFSDCVEPQRVPLLYDIIKVSSGDEFNLCLNINGRVWGFGSNIYHQLGLGPEYGDTDKVKTAIINPYLKNIKFIDCGYDFSLCIDEDGKAFTFGRNTMGECGAGHMNSVVDVPFCIQSTEQLKELVFVSGSGGHDHTMLITKDECLYGFGYNGECQTGNIGNPPVSAQYEPYKSTKTDIGIDEYGTIIKVICDNCTTIVVCEE